MTLKSPNLDDRRFDDLMETALARARESCRDWTDLSVGDPGRVMLELYAYLTEVMIYRLNRLPEKAYIEFLLLLGVGLQPPAAAVTTLKFSTKNPPKDAVEIPRGTRVAVARAGSGTPAIFTTADAADLDPTKTTAEVRAYHCEWFEGELVGHGTGLPGLSFNVRRPPIVAPTGDELELVVGVESLAAEADTSRSIHFGGKNFRLWREVEGFSKQDKDALVYVANRSEGKITFAPALRMTDADGQLDTQPVTLAAVPQEGREVRVWYRSGGGSAGNVAAGTLTVLKDPVPGVMLQVTNEAEATGGRERETIENALRRGPQELHSLRRAVTAQDFELLALRSTGGIDRAYAYTKFDLWKYAQRGTIEVVCIPHVPQEVYGTGPVTLEMLKAHENPEALEQVQKMLDTRRPLGTRCLVGWGLCKKVRVKTKVIVHREEDTEGVERRIMAALNNLINPLQRGPGKPLWTFGQPLSAYHVYRIISEEAGVKYVDPVRLCVDDTPRADVSGLSVDPVQPHTWYASAGERVMRTSDNGDGWGRVASFPGEKVNLLEAYPKEAMGSVSRAGMVAAVTYEEQRGESGVYVSRDCGESWEAVFRPQFRVEDMAWLQRDGTPALLLATEKGLFEQSLGGDPVPKPVLVDPQKQDLGFYAVEVSTDVWGQTSVAVAARGRGGVWLSTDGGKPETFTDIGLRDQKVRVLAVQHRGPHRYLWAGMEAAGDDKGEGCARWQLPSSPEKWEFFSNGWDAGGCRTLAFLDSLVLAGSRRHGVLRLDVDARQPRWTAPDVQSRLPMEKLGRMRPVEYIAATPTSEPAVNEQRLILVAGPAGVYRSRDQGQKYEDCSEEEFTDRVTLPQTWLFCSGDHEIDVDYR